MQTIIITGINGFVGQHLAREAYASGCDVIGLGNSDHLHPALNHVVKAYYPCDLTNPATLKRIPLEDISCLINLAGLANVGSSFDKPSLYEDVNVGIIRNLCDELLDRKILSTRVLVISTGAVYDPASPAPFTEESPLVLSSKTSPYVQSKLHAEDTTAGYVSKGLPCFIVRPFNHIGPGQLPGFILPDLTRKLSIAKETGLNSISVGNLQNKRDFTDVRDVVKAYRMLALAPVDKLRSKVYNVCSGKSLKGRFILDQLLDSMDMPNTTFTTDSDLIRPSDPELLVGSYSRLSTDTGWQPTIPIEQTIKDFVSWYQST